ncbi:Hypothetical predicted protein [Mytilus galloprovincialis]|uniref:Uncharacterized protein n=1 Tax=Mytilus galloprovincialis TaxID=29158 RepID=A0A8B6EQC0_MYTGA|nr:Hypothetical predicted protein [Mytilus galloprovincialis]
MLQCRFCSYMVPTSKRFRLNEHEKNVHRHILNPRTNNRELVIPETPTRNQCQPLILIQDKVAQSLDQEKLWKSPEKKLVLVPEKPTPEPSTVTTTLRDSRHLALPAIGDEVCPEDRFQAPPSRFQCSYEASKCMLVAEKAKKTGKIYRQCIASRIWMCEERKKCVFCQMGQFTNCSATWVPDPSFQILKVRRTYRQKSVKFNKPVRKQRISGLCLQQQPPRRGELLRKREKVQTEDCRVVMEKDTEEELELDIEEEYMDFDFYH